MKSFALAALCAILLLAGCGASTRQLRTQAVSEFQRGKLDTAEILLSRALAKSPSDVESLYYMGRIRHTDGFYEQAMYYYQAALRIEPGFDVARHWLDRAQEQIGTVGQTLRVVP
jgi:tetratricopeptide (TPR) repeat protein